MGAVIAEETTNGIREIRNRAFEKLFNVILAIMLIGLSLFFFIHYLQSHSSFARCRRTSHRRTRASHRAN